MPFIPKIITAVSMEVYNNVAPNQQEQDVVWWINRHGVCSNGYIPSLFNSRHMVTCSMVEGVCSGKSALVLFFHVISYAQYEISVIWLLGLAFIYFFW